MLSSATFFSQRLVKAFVCDFLSCPSLFFSMYTRQCPATLFAGDDDKSLLTIQFKMSARLLVEFSKALRPQVTMHTQQRMHNFVFTLKSKLPGFCVIKAKDKFCVYDKHQK